MSLFHAIPAAAIGVVLALVVMWSGSLAGGVVIHLVNNTIAVVASRRPELVEPLDSVPAIVVGLVMLVTGLAILRARAVETAPA
jgi:membrane protease YdiL (CAAX protease family)